ncbi:MAG: glycosyltransferase family 4 protein, partial [Leptolyngbya sp. SIO4C5]|nr:glycosyltransferase family 4 protein [Leptolyngbya sp. SIO4C5]
MDSKSKRLLIVLYAGDYREAYYRLANGQSETYHAHRYAIESISKLGKQIDEAAVLCCYSKEPYNELVEPGFRVIGTGFDRNQAAKHLIKFIADQRPTHLVVRAPIKEILQWGIAHGIHTITLLADSFQNQSLKHKFRNFQLARLLNNPQIEWVGNHGVNACQNLQQIGVKPSKIVPWDWVYSITPSQYTAKHLPQRQKPWELVYVGSISEAKGVSDLIEAISILKQQGIAAKLKIAGKGNLTPFHQQISKLNLEAEVSFLGLVAHNSVIDLMRNSDFVLVPSRPEYPEGFPLTIYEGFCSRTPIIGELVGRAVVVDAQFGDDERAGRLIDAHRRPHDRSGAPAIQ